MVNRLLAGVRILMLAALFFQSAPGRTEEPIRLRERFPAVAVVDVYRHRRLGELAERLDAIAGAAAASRPGVVPGAGRWRLVQLAGVLASLLGCFRAPAIAQQ